MNFKRVATGLEVAYFASFGFLKVLKLINKTLSKLCSLDLVLKHDLLLNLIGNDRRPARGSVRIFFSRFSKLDLSLLVFFALLLP